jgi:hypothetical protein
MLHLKGCSVDLGGIRNIFPGCLDMYLFLLFPLFFLLCHMSVVFSVCWIYFKLSWLFRMAVMCSLKHV